MTFKALILVDYQNEWIDKDSEEYVWNISDEIEKTNKLIDFCKNNWYKIIFTRHVEIDSQDKWSEQSNWTKIIFELNKEKSDIIIAKHKISPFYKTNLEKELENIEEIIVCWILTNLCVRSLIHDAYDRDLKIKVIKDCCVSFDKETQNFTFNDLKSTREEIEFLDLNDFIN